MKQNLPHILWHENLQIRPGISKETFGTVKIISDNYEDPSQSGIYLYYERKEEEMKVKGVILSVGRGTISNGR